MTFTTTEIDQAYAATKSLGSPIGRADIDVRKLTSEQAEALINWCKGQNCSTFEDKDGNPFPLQAILDLWHVSVVYENFDSWFSEEPDAARKAYVAVCRRHKIKHGA